MERNEVLARLYSDGRIGHKGNGAIAWGLIYDDLLGDYRQNGVNELVLTACLLALLREATDDETYHIRKENDWERDDQKWFLCRWETRWESIEHVCYEKGFSDLTTSGYVLSAATELGVIEKALKILAGGEL